MLATRAKQEIRYRPVTTTRFGVVMHPSAG